MSIFYCHSFILSLTQVDLDRYDSGMSKQKTILVFTGGGLAPALNPTLYGVISAARQRGYRILGGMFGWKALTKAGKIVELEGVNIKSLQSVGGTFLRSSRTNPFQAPDLLDELKEQLKHYAIDVIVAIGGDDTLGAAQRLFAEEGIATIGIPKTVDNDLSATYFTPGFPSAAEYLYTFVEQVRVDAAYALSRVYIIESLGQKVGWLTAASAYGQPDVILPPEREYDLEAVLEAIKGRYQANGNFAAVVVSEEANFSGGIAGQADDQAEAFGHHRKNFVALELRKAVKNRLGIDCKALFPGNYLQAGPPNELDRTLAIKLGEKAVDLIATAVSGMMPCIVQTPDTKKLTVEAVPLVEAVGEGRRRALTDELFDFKKFWPRQAYFDYLEPILGKYQEPADDYWQLISAINPAPNRSQ